MMKNSCRLVLRNSRNKILILVETWLVEFVDRLRRTMSRKLRDNNGEIETRLNFWDTTEKTMLLAVNLVMQAR